MMSPSLIELNQWTKNTSAKEGLVVNKKIRKQLFGGRDLIQFNGTFWAIDDAQFTHPRNEAQVQFAIVVLASSSLIRRIKTKGSFDTG